MSAKVTVAQFMTRHPHTIGSDQPISLAHRMMRANDLRHLPVLAKDKVVGVVSIRDLLREAVDHHAKIIGELERERMTMTTSMV